MAAPRNPKWPGAGWWILKDFGRKAYERWWRRRRHRHHKPAPHPHPRPHPQPKPQPVVNPTKTIAMFDDVNLDLIPKDAKAVGGYVGGRWPTYSSGEIQKRWPHALYLSFAIAASLDADALDIERGDATPDEAPAWVKRQLARRAARVAYNSPLPVVYTNAAAAQSLVDLLAKSGLKKDKHYLLGTAHYTGVKHFCGPHCGFGLKVTADATQWTDKAKGRSLDEWVCSPGFFLEGRPV